MDIDRISGASVDTQLQDSLKCSSVGVPPDASAQSWPGCSEKCHACASDTN
jgi:hypothetical protein